MVRKTIMVGEIFIAINTELDIVESAQFDFYAGSENSIKARRKEFVKAMSEKHPDCAIIKKGAVRKNFEIPIDVFLTHAKEVEAETAEN